MASLTETGKQKIEINTDTVTVRNNELEITVSRHSWDDCVADGKPNGCKQTPEQHARCIIISNYKRAQEHKKFVENYVPPTEEEIFTECQRLADLAALCDALENPYNCPYNPSEVFFRLTGGHRLSDGMALAVSRARAEAAKNPHNPNEYREQAIKNLNRDFIYSSSVQNITMCYRR